MVKKVLKWLVRAILGIIVLVLHAYGGFHLWEYVTGGKYIKDLKRMTPSKHKSLIKMNGKNNPYSGSARLNTTIQLLPVTELFEMNDEGKPYVQYTVFVRNSDWAEPMEE